MVSFEAQTQPPPARGERTLAELGTELITVSGPDDANHIRFDNSNGVRYEPLSIPSGDEDGVILGGARRSGRGGRPVNTQLLGNKPKGMLIQRVQENVQEVIQKQVYARIDSALQWLVEHRVPLLNTSAHELPSGEDSVPVLSAVAPGRNFHVRLMAWHPYRPLLAIAHMSDRIYIYDLEAQAFLPQALSHPFQKDVSAIEWRPNHGTMLAVAVRHGTLLWRVHFDCVMIPPTRRKEGSANNENNNGSGRAAERILRIQKHVGVLPWATFLRYEGHDGISALSWSPSGQLLATGCADNGSIIVWDIAFESPTLFRRAGFGTSLLRWSPDGSFLAVGSRGGALSLRIFETRTWQQKCLPVSGFIQTSCWTSDSKSFLFAIRDTSDILAVVMESATSLKCRIIGPWSLPKHSRSSTNNTPITVGGCIAEISLDPMSERLVVSFQGEFREDEEFEPPGSELVATFIVRPHAFVRDPKSPLMPSGFIRGPSWNISESEPAHISDNKAGPKAVCLRFAQKFDRGSLLAAAWEDGTISFIPFYYLSTKHLQQHPDQLRRAAW